MNSPSPLDSSNAQSPHGPASRSSRKTAVIGALVGMTALAGTLVGVGAIASAQDDPAETTTTAPASAESDATDTEFFDADFEAYDACMAEQLGDLWIEPEIVFDDVFEDIPWDPADEQQFVDAEEACSDLLPDEIKAQIEAWRPYEECVDAQIGDLPDPWANGEEPSEADWEAHDAAWDAADDACSNLLPEGVQAEMAAWEAFDECLGDAGVFDEGTSGLSAVHIETGDGFQIAEFGDTEGSVTITGTDGNLSVTSTGGVTLLDEDALDAQWGAFDEAHEACEDLLPEDLDGGFGLGSIEVFDGEFED